MKSWVSVFVILSIFMLISCQSGDKVLITEKIQYDVNIKSPGTDYDWWIQNLVGPDREQLVGEILEGAKSGKYQCWDYYNESLSPLDIRSILSDTMILSIVDNNPPYETYDTTIIKTIELKDIQRLRFLERWEREPGSLQIEKTVYGIGPVALTFDPEGNERWYPLFWIYVDDEFIATLNKN